MSKQLTITDKEYTKWVQDLSERYRNSQIKAATKVNTEMLNFYWSLGKEISIRKLNMKYGDGFFNKLSHDLQSILPDVKSFSSANLRYMERFYLLYSQNTEIFPQVGETLFQIPWGHHKYIIDRFSDNPQKALFFVKKTIENGWSRNMLLNFFDTDLYERQGKGITNFKNTLPAIQSDLAQEITKDPYNFDFLTLTDIDNPTIGLLICKTKDNVLAKYALESSNQPIGISEYELSKLYPSNFKSSMPTIDEIEKGLC